MTIVMAADARGEIGREEIKAPWRVEGWTWDAWTVEVAVVPIAISAEQ